MTVPVTRLLTDDERPFFSWLEEPGLKSLCATLETDQAGSVRYVGGCVRDGLLGIEADDIDVATTMQPTKVIEILLASGIKTIPTGIEHGTVTAILKNRAVEITTLRRDVSTDGRRAIVSYTDDWVLDAQRRDFRINAIYLSPNGMLFDPVGGLDDLRLGAVRFIGNARDRIVEDYLRILRFFRFSNRFSTTFDVDGLHAIREEANGMNQLSRERVGSEFLKILALPNAHLAIHSMADVKVLAQIWGAHPYMQEFESFKKLVPEGDAIAGLAVLFGKDIDGLSERLRLSNQQSTYLKACLEAELILSEVRCEQSAKKALYQLGKDVWRDGIYVAQARLPERNSKLQEYISLPEQWEIPEFPFSGQSLLDKGLSPGPMISAILKEAESRWIEADFPLGEQASRILDSAIAAKK